MSFSSNDASHWVCMRLPNRRRVVFLFGVYSFLWYENLESEHYVICAICCSSLDYQERKTKTPERVAFSS